jgi:signal transduction histidine kinase
MAPPPDPGLLAALPAPALVVDRATGEVLGASDALARLLGREPAELVGARPPHPWLLAEDEHGAWVLGAAGVPVRAEVARGDLGLHARVVLLHPVPEDRLEEGWRLETLGLIAAPFTHRLNNALAAALGTTELMQALAPPGSADAHRLERIRASAGEARDAVAALRRLLAPPLEHRGQVALAEVASEAVRLVRATGLAWRAELREDYPAEPLRVRGSAGELLRLVVTLLALALGERPGVVVVALRRAGPSARLRVGAEAEREPAGLDALGPGLATSLAAAFAIAARHGGRLAVDAPAGSRPLLELALPALDGP